MNNSLWLSKDRDREYSKLDKNINTTYLVVGGGIVGVTTAVLLSKRGLDIVLIDADYIGYGASGRNTGKLTPQHNIIYSKIYKTYGGDIARDYYESNKKALELIESMIKDYKIECDFERVASYIYAQNEESSEILLEEFEICRKIGIDCEYLAELPIDIEAVGAIKFNMTGQFDPKKYIDGLIKVAEDNGVRIYEKTAAIGIDIYDGLPHKVNTIDGYIIQADNVIICSHFPFYDGLSFYFTRLKPERSYLVAGEYDNDFPKATFISIDEPKRSLRYYNNGDKSLLLIGGENHKVGQDNEEDYYENLKRYGKDKFNIENYKYQWSTQDYITPDFIPYMGYLNSVKENIYVATGFCKWGMTNGTAGAILLDNLCTGEKAIYEKLYNPSRTEGYSNIEFYKQNANTTIEYISGKLKIASKDMPDIDEGKVVSIDRKKYGAYRDKRGILHLVDITCTHLGCKLKWNGLEKSWDCPCHGSRFSIDGNILEGPATIPLNYYGTEQKNQIHPNLI